MVETSYNVIYLPWSVFATCGTVTPDCRNTLHVFERLISYYRLKKYQGNTVNFQEGTSTEFGKNTEFSGVHGI